MLSASVRNCRCWGACANQQHTSHPAKIKKVLAVYLHALVRRLIHFSDACQRSVTAHMYLPYLRNTASPGNPPHFFQRDVVASPDYLRDLVGVCWDQVIFLFHRSQTKVLSREIRQCCCGWMGAVYTALRGSTSNSLHRREIN